MSTRANIIITDGEDRLYFYRHSDGYPEGTMPTLTKFLDLLKTGKIRNNVGQSAGWLIVLGAIEYQTIAPELLSESGKRYMDQDNAKIDQSIKDFAPTDWKVGAYEPTTEIHGDIEYLYVVDLIKKDITIIPESEWKLWDTKRSKLVKEQIKAIQSLPDLTEYQKQITVLDNGASRFEVDIAGSTLYCYDLLDKWNDTKGYNNTRRSIKKAWNALITAWTDSTTMYGGCDILRKNGIRMHTYCGND